MTIVACWLDEAYGVRSVAALADARASEEFGGKWYTHSDNTIKLFALEVRCFHVDSLSPGLGAHVNPYYETAIGVGFAGHCFEALTIIAHLQRAVGALSSMEGEPQPTREGLTNLARTIGQRHLTDHSYGAKRSLELALFGWEGPDLPWISRLVWDAGRRAVTSEILTPDAETIVTIGDGGATAAIGGLRKLLRKVGRRITLRGRSAPTERDTFRRAVLAGNASEAVAKSIGELVEDEFVKSVGGTRQKLQIAWDGARSIGAFTADDQPQVMDGLPSVNPTTLLAPIPIVQKMG